MLFTSTSDFKFTRKPTFMHFFSQQVIPNYDGISKYIVWLLPIFPSNKCKILIPNFKHSMKLILFELISHPRLLNFTVLIF